PIRSYGFMLWIALVVGLFWTIRASKKTNIKSEYVIDIALYALIAGIVFAHLASILLDLQYYISNPSRITNLWSGIFSPYGGLRGLSFHGGLIGGIVATLFYAKRKRINFFEVSDLFSPALALGYAITRIGCFLNGCCYGVPTNLSWSIRFHTGPTAGNMTPPSHPTQLYAMFANLIIFWCLLAIEKRRRFSGEVFLSYLTMYSIYRFLIEFLRRGVTAEIWIGGLTQAQWASIFIFCVAASILVLKVRKSKAKFSKAKLRMGG
ncbi:MAG: prolipoprotein diacylglyceryl transferase, partial [Armatimonadota bacterium]|nr:prolipoprotein diacylglyceryl transferase [Armatimonadota bacterium]